MSFLNTLTTNRFWKKHAAQSMWAIAFLCLASAIAMISWNVHSQAKIKQANYQPQNVSPITQSNVESYRVNDIVSANLFGDPTPKVVVKDAPKTTLDLKLQGVLWASDPKLARAIIVAGRKKSKLYSVGQEIKGSGASIKEIRQGEVLLDRNGATESLPMVKISSGTNEQLIVFSDPNADRLASQQQYNDPFNSASNKSGPRKTLLSNPRSRAPTSRLNRILKEQPKKLAEPDLSNLDKALQRMGEL